MNHVRSRSLGKELFFKDFAWKSSLFWTWIFQMIASKQEFDDWGILLFAKLMPHWLEKGLIPQAFCLKYLPSSWSSWPSGPRQTLTDHWYWGLHMHPPHLDCLVHILCPCPPHPSSLPLFDLHFKQTSPAILARTKPLQSSFWFLGIDVCKRN